METVFAADSGTLKYLSDLHYRIAMFYQKSYHQTSAHADEAIHELRRAERYDARAKYEQWKGSLSHLLDEMNTHLAWSSYFHDLAEQVDRAETNLS